MTCESGISLTKASVTRLMWYILRNNIELGQIYAFNPKFHGSLVCVSLRLRPDQFEEFERETGGKLRTPVQVHLNSTDSGKEP